MKYLAIHLFSLTLGAFFRTCYWALGKHHWVTEKSLELYRSCRRLLPGQTRGPNGRSTRHGASEAHQTTQEE